MMNHERNKHMKIDKLKLSYQSNSIDILRKETPVAYYFYCCAAVRRFFSMLPSLQLESGLVGTSVALRETVRHYHRDHRQWFNIDCKHGM